MLYPNANFRPWVLDNNKEKRAAIVNSFGFGGTNFCVVLEEYNKSVVSDYSDTPVVLYFTASNFNDLMQSVDESKELFENDFEKFTSKHSQTNTESENIDFLFLQQKKK